LERSSSNTIDIDAHNELPLGSFVGQQFWRLHHVRRNRPGFVFRPTRLLRHAFGFADLSFDRNSEPFAAVIRCACGGGADSKMISKWSRALRYVARFKEPNMRLKRFMKKAGGINACANRYAKHLGRGGRRQD
jgi:hypothetical protein